MCRLDCRAALEIGDGAGHPEEPVHGARREAELLEGRLEEGPAGSAQLAGILKSISGEG